MKANQRAIASLVLVMSFAILGCAFVQSLASISTPMPTATLISTATVIPTLLPTSIPIPTSTSIPTTAPEPGIGVSLQTFQSSFEEIGFVFEYENNNAQGVFTSADYETWVFLFLEGRKEDLSSVSLSVMNGTDKEKMTQILNLFFQVAFPVQSDRDEAMDWFANKSGINTGEDSGGTTIGNINLSWASDNVAGYVVFVNPKVP